MAMRQTEELLNRVISALDRIQSQVESGLKVESVDDPIAVAQLQAALEKTEKENLSLKEQLEKLQDTQSEEGTKNSADAQQATIIQHNDEIQRLRESNLQLRELVAALREANQELVGDAELVNASFSAELEGVRSERAADIAQMTTLIDQLSPLLQVDNERDAEKEK